MKAPSSQEQLQACRVQLETLQIYHEKQALVRVVTACAPCMHVNMCVHTCTSVCVCVCEGMTALIF
jgi:hypothetical protein